MTKIAVDLIRKLREETGAPIMRVKKALEEVRGKERAAFEILQKEGFERVAKREGKITAQGIISSYLHHNKKIVGVVELLTETDFVARSELFLELGQNLAMQVASMAPSSAEELKGQEFIKDPAKKISDIVKDVIVKTGENIRIGRIYRLELGK